MSAPEDSSSTSKLSLPAQISCPHFPWSRLRTSYPNKDIETHTRTWEKTNSFWNTVINTPARSGSENVTPEAMSFGLYRWTPSSWSENAFRSQNFYSDANFKSDCRKFNGFIWKLRGSWVSWKRSIPTEPRVRVQFCLKLRASSIRNTGR